MKYSKGLILSSGIIGLMLSGIFISDILLPAGIPICELYFIPTLYAAWKFSRNYLLRLTVISTVLVITGFLFDISPAKNLEATLHRGIELFILWLGYVLILKRKNSENRLENMTMMHESLIHNTHMLLAYLDGDFNFVMVNKRYAEADKKTTAFFVGKNHFDLYPNKENEEIFREVLKTGEPYFAYAKPFEYQHNGDNGISYWDWSLIPFKSSKGEVSGLILSLVNVSERVYAEKEIFESQARLDGIISSAMDAIISVDEDQKIILFNAAAEKMFLIPACDVLGKDIDILIPSGLREQHRQNIINFGNNPGLYSNRRKPGSVKACRTNGESFPLEASLSYTEIDSRKIYTIILRDITERKKSENLISDALEFNRKIFEASPLGIATYKSTGECVSVNEAFSSIIGAPKEKLMEQNFHTIESWKSSNVYLDAIETLTKGIHKHREIEITTTFGKELWLDWHFVSFNMQNETHLLLMINNITLRKLAEEAIREEKIHAELLYTEKLKEIEERKLTELKLNLTLEQLNRSNKELEQFAYVASHDLQEPLRMVASFTQLLANRYKNKLDDNANEFIGYAIDGAKRMQRLIVDLLEFSRITTKGKEFEIVDCNEVIKSVMDNLHFSILDSCASLTIAKLPKVMGDPVQLVQVFQNLISNALKFRSCKIPEIELGVSESSNSQWLFTIKDNGIGFDMQYGSKIFVLFQRLHDRQQYAGTGIGLALCKKIIERHGGKIWAESKPGEGAEFFFTLPAIPE